ncbi:MAG: tRNA uracil 4-sulfurtransferase ThiI [Candidatus Eisenbacteria bacterium]
MSTILPQPQGRFTPPPEFAPYDAIVVRYSEIFLKGENRRLFEDVLVKNVQRALHGAGMHGLRVRRHHARLLIEPEPGAPSAAVAARRLEDALPTVLGVFGASSASLAVSVPKDLLRIAARGAGALVSAARDTGARTFKVAARRSDKHFAHGSAEMNDMVGHAARMASGLTVDVKDPDLTLVVEIGPELSFVSAHSARGPGGLPVGVSGNVTLLLSGGIDSPVAGWLCQKRGCRLNAVYFHAFPYTGDGTKQKVLELARQLGRAQGGMRVTVIPFAAFQEACRGAVPPRLMIVIYRRAMARLAERVARSEDSAAIATGENLGQVASQTVTNLGTIERAIEMPVLRPLLTFDKNEIIAYAKRIGSFETSILPFDDCCALFAPRHPATRVLPGDALEGERRVHDYETLIDAAFAAREIVDLEG